jgi:hypothetical protein
VERPKFCYVLTTTGHDLFADMTYASAAFLRHAYPEGEIVCLCDAQSHHALAEARHPLLELIDRSQAVATPNGPAGFRNRFVKTQMRLILEGDFVYFDSDTLVVDRIDEILSCPAPLAGVPDPAAVDDPSGVDPYGQTVFETMGWQMPSGAYINGGVLLMRDCEPTRRFARLWHEKWKDWSRRGRHTDQQSLNSALADSGIEYGVLENRFNAQVNGRPSLCLEPVAVWHLYSSHHDNEVMGVPTTILDEAITRFRSEGRLTPDVIHELSQWPFPWRTPWVLDRWFVKRFVIRRNNLPWDGAARYWLAERRLKAVKTHLRDRYRGLKWRWKILFQRALAEIKPKKHRGGKTPKAQKV